MRQFLASLGSILVFGTSVAAAQCPDGTPPPCRGVTRRSVPASAPDPNRVAILPFRVTTADSLLGEGVAELLSEEFTGEGGPRAVHMGSTIRAWRQAGGGSRSPLAQPDEIRVAANLGAGLLVDGSIVGLGQRLTLSAAVVAVQSGVVRRITPLTGHSDSLPELIGRLAANLLGVAGSRSPSGPSPANASRLSDIPAANRAYIEGLAEFRRGRFIPAADAFERAFAADTLFARAAFMRWATVGWGGPGFGNAIGELWKNRSVALGDRLSTRDRVVLEAAIGNLAARERAAERVPDSPEIWYYIGDAYYHGARFRGWNESTMRARAAFERSVALDSQVSVLHHLVELGLWTGDTALVRSAWSAYDHLVGGVDPGIGWTSAAVLGDRRLLDALRIRLGQPRDDERQSWSVFGLLSGAEAGVSAALLDEGFARSQTGATALQTPSLRLWRFYALSAQGRAGAAMRVVAEGPLRDSILGHGFSPDLLQSVAAALGSGDPAVGAAATARLRAVSRPDSDGARARCAVRLWDALAGDSIAHDDDDRMRMNGQRACVELLDVLEREKHGTLDSLRLASADSLARDNSAVLFDWSGVGPTVLARVHEAHGDRRQALALLRRANVGFPPDWMMAIRRRNEARLAALDGDTATAIRVYHEYLLLRRDAEPALIPQRDSVQAELHRLLPWRPRAVP